MPRKRSLEVGDSLAVTLIKVCVKPVVSEFIKLVPENLEFPDPGSTKDVGCLVITKSFIYIFKLNIHYASFFPLYSTTLLIIKIAIAISTSIDETANAGTYLNSLNKISTWRGSVFVFPLKCPEITETAHNVSIAQNVLHNALDRLLYFNFTDRHIFFCI